MLLKRLLLQSNKSWRSKFQNSNVISSLRFQNLNEPTNRSRYTKASANLVKNDYKSWAIQTSNIVRKLKQLLPKKTPKSRISSNALKISPANSARQIPS